MVDEKRKVWLAAVMDAEGSFVVFPKHYKGKQMNSYGFKVSCFNTDERFVDFFIDCCKEIGVECWKSNRLRNPLNWSREYTAHVSDLNSLVIFLESILPYLVIKRDIAREILYIAKERWMHIHNWGKVSRWTPEQTAFAASIRDRLMPKSEVEKRTANGETETSSGSSAIPCQAEGSTTSTSEGVETRDASSASSNRPHECPGPQQHLKVAGG